MNKVRNKQVNAVDVPDADTFVPVASSTTETASVPATNYKMAEEDRLALELAKSRRETALANAKEALAKNDNAELNYKYIVLQLYMKYGLTAADAISEGGDIVRGGALQQPQSK